MLEEVILVDSEDRELGTCEKLKAHQEGLLHRAFSIFIFNSKDEMLLHQRAHEKYHSGGLWTNACCSHPRPGESLPCATERRLLEEVGFTCPVKPFGTLLYRAEVDQELIEHEFDHLFIGTYDGPIDCANPREVAALRWIAISELLEEMAKSPEQFTAWFRLALPKVLSIQADT